METLPRHSLETQDASNEEREMTLNYSDSGGAGEPFYGENSSRDRFLLARYRVRLLRDQTSRGRLSLQQMRFELRSLRRRTRKIEESVLSTLDVVPTQQLHDKRDAFSSLIKDLQAAYDEVKLKEDEYDADEDRVAAAELTLQSEEEKFYKTYDRDPIAIRFDASPESSVSHSPARPPSVRAFPSPNPLNPLQDYETEVGHARVLREELDNMIFEREQIMQENARLDSLGEEIDPLDLRFLSNFKQTFGDKVEHLRRTEREISRLEQDAIGIGLLHPSAAYSSLTSRPALPGISPEPVVNFQDVSSVHGAEANRPHEVRVKAMSHLRPTASGYDGPVELTAASSSGSNVKGWLGKLYTPLGRILSMAEDFRARDSRGTLYHSLSTFLASPGRQNQETSVETVSNVATVPDSKTLQEEQHGVGVEPYSIPVRNSTDRFNDRVSSPSLEGLGQWHEQAGPSTSSSPHDWEWIHPQSQYGSLPNGSLTFNFLSSIWNRVLPHPPDDQRLGRPKTLEGQPQQPKVSHSARLDMNMDNQESRSV
jgi:hypothetical protein